MTSAAAKTQATWGPGIRVGRTETPNTLAAEAYERIRADVVAGRLTPGTKLLTEAIKERYGIGGSPMREALTRLAADGLLKNEGQKGFRVASASIGELADIGHVRLHLELKALADSIRYGSVDWEVSVVSSFHRLRHAVESYSKDPAHYADEWEATHRAFHFALLSGCGSPWLLHFCDRIYDQTERYRRLYTPYDKIPPPLISSHKEIMDAVLARELEKGLTLARDHIAFATRQTLADMIASGVSSDAAGQSAIDSLQDTTLQPLLA